MVVIAMFVAGLMVGRTPEYLGKKIEAKEVKMTLLAILCLPLAILGFTADRGRDPDRHGRRWAIPARTASRRRSMPIPRARRTTARLSAASPGNTIWYNLTIGDRHAGRPLLRHHPGPRHRRLLRGQEDGPASAGTFPTHGGLFVGLLVGVILIVGGLTYFPSLALGPIVEHLAMVAGQTFGQRGLSPCAPVPRRHIPGFDRTGTASRTPRLRTDPRRSRPCWSSSRQP